MFQAWPVKIMITAASSSPMLLCGNMRDQRENQPRHEAEHGNALQNVEQRDEDALGGAIFGGPIAVHQREQERDGVGEQAAREREERVAGQGPGGEIDFDGGAMHAGPFAAQIDQSEEQSRQCDDDQQIGPGERAQG